MKAINIIVLLIIVFAGCSKKIPQRKHAPEQEIAMTNGIDRAIVMRDKYMSVLPLSILPRGNEYTKSYFVNLKKRKQAVIAWLKQNPVTITFIGQMHINLAGSDSASSPQAVKKSQQWVYEQLEKVAPKVQLITFEEPGSKEIVTLDTMEKHVLAELTYVKPFVGDFPTPSLADVRKMIQVDTQGVFRFMRTHTNPPIYFGEEWPCTLETHILMMKDQLPQGEPQVAAESFINDFNHLRSEIIVIRTLEFLMERNGKRAAIVQGAWHTDDMIRIAPEYGFALDLASNVK